MTPYIAPFDVGFGGRYDLAPFRGIGEITVTDLFAGAGGSSTGMIQIPGVRVLQAANHWKLACDVHQKNHPMTDHAVVDLHQERPAYFQRTDILWASPECTKWSQSNSQPKPAIEEGLFEDPLSDEAVHRSRLLMFDVLRFIEHHNYRVAIIENVVDIATQPRYATAWSEWQRQLRGLGYTFRVLSLNAMYASAYGDPAPQSRDRIYIVAWHTNDTAPDLDPVLRPRAYCPKCEQTIEAQQSWKNGRTVGKYKQQYLYVHGACGTVVEPDCLPAAAAIDWSIPGTVIGDRLVPKTRARIAAGIARYWGPFHLEAAGNTYDAADPAHRSHGDPAGYYRTWGVDEPLKTLHTTPTKALAVPVEGRDGKQAQPLTLPLRTQTTRAETAMVVPSGGTWNEEARLVDEPHRTLTTRDSYGLAQLPMPFVAELRGGGSDARSVTDPAATFCASGNHHALVTRHYGVGNGSGAWHTTPSSEVLRTVTATGGNMSLVTPYYGSSRAARPASEPVGTLTTVDRYGLVNDPAAQAPMFNGFRAPAARRRAITAEDLRAAEAMVSDCLFRMFMPLEVAAGMAFPGTYDWDVRDGQGKLPSKRNLVKAMGNAVCPPCARDIIAAAIQSMWGLAA